MSDVSAFTDRLDRQINFWINLYLKALVDEIENEIATQCLGLIYAKIKAEEKTYQKFVPEFRWTERLQEISEQRAREEQQAHKTKRIDMVSVRWFYFYPTVNKHPSVYIRRYDRTAVAGLRHTTARYEIRNERRAHRIQKLFANREVTPTVFENEIQIKFNVEV